MSKYLSDREYQRIMNSPGVQQVLEDRADQIADVTRKGVKQVTGATADSVAVVKAVRSDGVNVRRVGFDLDVDENGPYYEFGTEDTAPHPNLRAAARSVMGRR